MARPPSPSASCICTTSSQRPNLSPTATSWPTVRKPSRVGSLGEGNGPSSVWHFLRHGRKVPPIVDLLVRAGTVSSDALARRAREQADVLFKPPLETVDLLDWQACDYAIGVGYRHAIGQLEHADKSGLSAPW